MWKSCHTKNKGFGENKDAWSSSSNEVRVEFFRHTGRERVVTNFSTFRVLLRGVKASPLITNLGPAARNGLNQTTFMVNNMMPLTVRSLSAAAGKTETFLDPEEVKDRVMNVLKSYEKIEPSKEVSLSYCRMSE